MILLVSRSGGGKDFLVKAFNLNQVISNTERPMRGDEKNGVHKNFFYKGYFEEFIKDKEKIIAMTNINGYYYWVTEKDLKGKDVFIVDVKGVDYLFNIHKKDFYKKFKIVYIDCPIWKRFFNMLKRKDSLINIVKRLVADHEAFKGIDKYEKTVIKM